MKNLCTDFNHSPYALYDRPLPETDEEVRDLTRQFAGSRLFFTVSLSGRIIGYIGFHKVKDAYDLGYCFHSSCHGNGYAYESVKALLNYLVRKYQIRKITAGTALDNAPSCSLLKKLGFICVSTEPLSFEMKVQSGSDTVIPYLVEVM